MISLYESLKMWVILGLKVEPEPRVSVLVTNSYET